MFDWVAMGVGVTAGIVLFVAIALLFWTTQLSERIFLLAVGALISFYVGFGVHEGLHWIANRYANAIRPPPSLRWLARPLVCQGETVLAGLDPAALSDADLKAILLRMNALHDTIENEYGDGRFISLEILGGLEDLEEIVLKGLDGPARLAEWKDFIAKFGDRYGLEDEAVLPIDPNVWKLTLAKFNRDSDGFGAPRYDGS